jgi:hypothetical protein
MIAGEGHCSTPKMVGCLHSTKVTTPNNYILIFPQSIHMVASSIQLKSKLKARDGLAKASHATTIYLKW